MFKILCTIFTISLLSLSCDTMSSSQKLSMPELFSDHMVLQHDSDITLWGMAKPGSKIDVKFRDQSAAATANENAQWKLTLKSEKAGGPDSLLVSSRNEKLVFHDVLVGEVWLCSGQSNMEMPLISNWAHLDNAEEEVQNAQYPDIRLFKVERKISYSPTTEISTKGWQACSPQTVADFSAVGYFFGRDVHLAEKVPVGLIESAWGGTIVEAWTSAEPLKKLDDFREAVQMIENSPSDMKEVWAQYQQKHAEWEKFCQKLDPGIENGDTLAVKPDYDDSSWKTMDLPILWENTEVGAVDGAVWFRKSVEVPASWLGKGLTLRIGPCDDHDVTWFNGVKIGEGHVYNAPRVYNIPADLVKEGRNVIAVRVVDDQGGGGIWGEAKDFGLDNPDGPSIDLSGTWRWMLAYDKKDCPPEPGSPEQPNQPTVLYNGMIYPIQPFTIRGAIWYQGESNASRAYQYRTLFKTMILDWRNQWGYDFPFLFVQLANFMDRNEQPVDDTWAELREAQSMALELPNTGMAVTIDIGNAKDIHPGDKQDVGKRLALWAQNKVYGEDIPFSGPLYKSSEIKNNKIVIHFDHVYDGLKTSDGKKPRGFAVAGDDKKFVWADAKIAGNTVVVSSLKIKKPVAVRYGWSSNPDVNLSNSADLPASPFRTDQWPGLTVNSK